MRNFFNIFKTKSKDSGSPKKDIKDVVAISPGRVSVPEDSSNTSVYSILKGMTKMVNPSFRREVIPLIRDLYKVNPDMSIALQDTFK